MNMSENIINENGIRRFLEMRELLFKGIKEALNIDGYYKSCEGDISIIIDVPGYFEDESEICKPYIKLSIYSYSLAEQRNNDFIGDSLLEVSEEAIKEIHHWINNLNSASFD